ncbi:hypothetical protein Q1695_014890 [Nippostrongylus brasiliensis]|nr:hypothetical protein Q1695_014890 [Nippostrongylus brasiliensis]
MRILWEGRMAAQLLYLLSRPPRDSTSPTLAGATFAPTPRHQRSRWPYKRQISTAMDSRSILLPGPAVPSKEPRLARADVFIKRPTSRQRHLRVNAVTTSNPPVHPPRRLPPSVGEGLSGEGQTLCPNDT